MKKETRIRYTLSFFLMWSSLIWTVIQWSSRSWSQYEIEPFSYFLGRNTFISSNEKGHLYQLEALGEPLDECKLYILQLLNDKNTSSIFVEWAGKIIARNWHKTWKKRTFPIHVKYLWGKACVWKEAED